MKKLLGDLYEEIFAYPNICEIRLNANRPIWLQTRSKRIILPHTVGQEDLDRMLEVACDYSVYTAVDKMTQGYIPYRKGVRIGLGGLYTLSDGRIRSVGPVSSLVVRIARVVEGASAPLPLSAIDGKSVLVISPPLGGKTTFLRDLATRLSARYAVVMVDERDELAGGGALDVGDCTLLRGSPKALVYLGVVRALSPQYVVFDELMGADEGQVAADIKRSGIRVLAGYHAPSVREVPDSLAAQFEVIVTLSAYPATGTIEGVRYA